MKPRKSRALKNHKRDSVISIRMTPADRQLFEELALIEGRDVGPTIVMCARPTARQMVAKETERCICRCDTQTAVLKAQDEQDALEAQAAQQSLAVA